MTAPRLESPLPEADCLRFFWPTFPPISVASTTNAIHPRIAVLRCCALHLPARAARFLGCKSLSPVESLSTARNRPSREALAQDGLPVSGAASYRGVGRVLAPGRRELSALRPWGGPPLTDGPARPRGT